MVVCSLRSVLLFRGAESAAPAKDVWTMVGKLHHYVPKFYLRRFADLRSPRSRPRTWAYDRAGSAPRLVSTRKVAAENYYYSQQTRSGQRDHSLEQALSDLEGAVAPLLDRLLLDDPNLRSEEAAPLACFMGLLYTRGPRFRALSSSLVSGVARAHAEHLAADEQRVRASLDAYRSSAGQHPKLTPERILAFLRSGKYKIKADGTVLLQTMIECGSRIAQVLLRLRWAVLHAPSGAFFVTSDAPLVLTAPTGHLRASNGFSAPGAEITLPIDPLHCLLLTHSGASGHCGVDSATVRELNTRTFDAAVRFGFSHRRDEALRQDRRLLNVLEYHPVAHDVPTRAERR